LRYSQKDERHRGEYKKLSNNVVAFDADGKMMGVVFETTLPFDTPRRMIELAALASVLYAGFATTKTQTGRQG
jgi:hypothetical protein